MSVHDVCVRADLRASKQACGVGFSHLLGIKLLHHVALGLKLLELKLRASLRSVACTDGDRGPREREEEPKRDEYIPSVNRLLLRL